MEGINKADKKLYILLLLVVLSWGLSWPANKTGLSFIPPLWFATLRLSCGTLCMFIIAACFKKLILPTRQDLPLIFALGVFQIGLFILFINLGLALQSAGSAAMLVYTTPLWVMPVAVFFFKEHSSFLKWIGFFLGLIGIFILLNPKEINWFDHNTLRGVVFLLGASFSFAISILCARHMTWHHTPLELISWQLLIGALLVAIIAFILQPHPHIELNITSGICIAYTAIVATALGFLGMSKLSKELPSIIISLSFLGVPVSGVLFSVLLLHEPLYLYMVIAMIFIIGGLICVTYAEKKR